MSVTYPDQLQRDVYYTADELRGWVRREWLEDYPSWVVAVLENGKMVLNTLRRAYERPYA